MHVTPQVYKPTVISSGVLNFVGNMKFHTISLLPRCILGPPYHWGTWSSMFGVGRKAEGIAL
jgi:hypothetical protein